MKVYKHPTHSNVTVVELPKKEIKKIDFALCKQPKETLKAFYDRQTEKPDFIINGGFFNMSDGKTIFNYTDEGKDVVSGHWTRLGMGVIGDNTLEYCEVGSIDWSNCRDFIAAYPPLIQAGRLCPITTASEINYKARRSVLAYDKENVYLIAVELPGMTFQAMQTMLLDMDMDYAINLDGGGSTKILQDGKPITSTTYNRAVDNVVAVYLKNTIYRVQVGAFSKQINAISLRTKIRALPDEIGAGYKNAYIRKIGNYYKVQVGAFSKEVNAMRVLNNLRSMGLEAFITTE